MKTFPSATALNRTTHFSSCPTHPREPGTRHALPRRLLVLGLSLLLTALSGCGLLPADPALDPSALATDDNLVTPAPKAPGYREESLTLGEGEWQVSGMLCLPETDFFAEPYPAVVLISDSGPNDMDETLYASAPFRDLAHGLATRGVATLRFNKITKDNEKLIKSLKDTLTLTDEYLPTVQAARAWLATESRVRSDRIFLLGHGLGGTFLPRLAGESEQPAGYILMGAGNTFLADELIRQYTYLFDLDGKQDTDETAALAQVEAQRTKLYEMLEGTRKAEGDVLGAPFSYWQDLRVHDPLKEIAALRAPVLILQGGRDYNVTPDQADAWEAALADHPDVTRVDYPALNHQMVAGEGPDDPVNLLNPTVMDEAPIADIADWVLRSDAP